MSESKSPERSSRFGRTLHTSALGRESRATRNYFETGSYTTCLPVEVNRRRNMNSVPAGRTSSRKNSSRNGSKKTGSRKTSSTKSKSSLSSEQRHALALAKLDLRQSVRRQQLRAEAEVQPLLEVLERTRVMAGLPPDSEDDDGTTTEGTDDEGTDSAIRTNDWVNQQNQVRDSVPTPFVERHGPAVHTIEIINEPTDIECAAFDRERLSAAREEREFEESSKGQNHKPKRPLPEIPPPSKIPLIQSSRCNLKIPLPGSRNVAPSLADIPSENTNTRNDCDVKREPSFGNITERHNIDSKPKRKDLLWDKPDSSSKINCDVKREPLFGNTPSKHNIDVDSKRKDRSLDKTDSRSNFSDRNEIPVNREKCFEPESKEKLSCGMSDFRSNFRYTDVTNNEFIETRDFSSQNLGKPNSHSRLDETSSKFDYYRSDSRRQPSYEFSNREPSTQRNFNYLFDSDVKHTHDNNNSRIDEKRNVDFSRTENSIENSQKFGGKQLNSPRDVCRSWIDEFNITNQSVQEGENPLKYGMVTSIVLPVTDPDVPKFTGDSAEWPEWMLTWKSRVHDNMHLTDARRIDILGSSLADEPRSKIFALLWDARNYGRALSELQRIYGNAAYVIDSYLNKVRSYPNIRSNVDIPGFCTKIVQLVQTFQTMGFEEDLRSKGLLSELKSKLPDSMLESWGKYVMRRGKGNPDVLLFHDWLVEKEEAMRQGGFGASRPSRTPRIEPQPSRKLLATGGTYTQTRSSAPIPNNKKCVCCQSREHWIEECPEWKKKSKGEKQTWFHSQNRCFICSRRGHVSKGCTSKNVCRICKKRHHSCVHDVFTDSPDTGASTAAIKKMEADIVSEEPDVISSDSDEEATSSIDEVSPATDISVSVNKTSHSGKSTESKSIQTFNRILPVRVHSSNGIAIDTYAFIDGGAETSLIQTSLAKQLNLTGRKVSLSIDTILGSSKRRRSKLVKFWVSNPNMLSVPLKVDEAWTLDQLSVPSQQLPRDEDGKVTWSHVSNLNLPDIDASKVQILIGGNATAVHEPLEVRMEPNLPMAIRSPLGWSILGSVQPASEETIEETQPLFTMRRSCQALKNNFDELQALLESLWTTESFGCKYDDKLALSVEDKYALDCLNATLAREDVHYQVGILWENDNVVLENNREMALRRYWSLRRMLLANPELRVPYESSVNGNISVGYASLLTPEERALVYHRIHFLPHHLVTTKRKKPRVVYDAAAIYKGQSLNSNLISGPNLTSSQTGVLCRWRSGPIAVCGDIVAMFHRVRVALMDRHALRFFWNPDITSPEPPSEYCMNVHVFGAKSSPCCASFCLQQTARDNEGKFSAESLLSIYRSFYVDDYLRAFPSESDAIRITREVVAITATGGFELTKFVTNSPTVSAALKSKDDNVNSLDLDFDDVTSTRALGVHWIIDRDVFTFRSSIEVDTVEFSKRGLLRAAATNYDPIGFILPFSLTPKLLLQRLWEQKLDWDTPIGELESVQWRNWLDELQYLENFSVQRCYWPKDRTPVKFTLHLFSDASEKCFAAVAYLRVELDDGAFHVSFVMAKGRVAPIDSHRLTLNRLELQGAVLATRLRSTLLEELDLDISDVYFWTDSKTVLQYIACETRRFKVFVANRIAEIRDVSDPSNWLHVPGPLNPADDATRGVLVRDLTVEHRWLTGPAFLWYPQSSWPRQTFISPMEEDGEMRKIMSIKTSKCVIISTRHSSMAKLLGITVYVLRFVRNLKSIVISKVQPSHTPHISAVEIVDARLFWIRRIQQEFFAEELGLLKRGLSVAQEAKTSKMCDLTPILVNGIIRVGGRLANAKMSDAAKHPVILPHEHHFCKLLAVEAHESLHHYGVNYVISRLRARYWITNVRTLAKQTIFDCLQCHRRRIEPCVPIMAQLPDCRVSESCAFQFTGVDYAGPFLVKRGRGKVREKRWICLWTCLSTRGIYLDLCASLDTDSFIMALRRFFARKPRAQELYSDNGTNFVGANRELLEGIQRWNADTELHSFLALREISWHFNPPKAPHMGGAWERLVKCTKTALYATLKDQCFHEDILVTVLTEIEATLNSRPLTSIPDGPDDLEPLTPNHFIIGQANCPLPFDITYESDLSSRKRWKVAQAYAALVWRRFRQEYLPGLNVTRKWQTKNPNLSIGDLVLVVDDNAPRGSWPLGRILNVFPSLSDSCVRKVEVRTKSGVYIRPAAKLCLLEGSPSLVDKTKFDVKS